MIRVAVGGLMVMARFLRGFGAFAGAGGAKGV